LDIAFAFAGSASAQKAWWNCIHFRSNPRLGPLYPRAVTCMLSENSDDPALSRPSRRGRPPLPWDRFHLEVAALLRVNAPPTKEEAAIHHFEAGSGTSSGVASAAGRSARS
jgi:hypothetical protein